MKRTPLYEAHHASGATFADVHEGWELAAYFTDAQAEHHVVRNSVGIIDLSHRGRLWLTGSDRARYLHRIISNDVETLKVGQGNYAMMLTNRGKIIADMKVYALEDAIGIETSAEAADALYQELDKYLIADDVIIEDFTTETGTIGVHGPSSSELVQAVLDLDVNELPEHHIVRRQMGDHALFCIRENETGEIGYNIHSASASMGSLWDTLLTKGLPFGVKPVGLAALDSLRIEAGIPRYGAELDDSIIPLEAELDNAISFEKGCYIGQEIVARMKYRGHSNRLLRGLEIEGEPTPQHGNLIFSDEKEIGRITSAANSPTLGKTIAMGYVRTAFADGGGQVQVETGSGRVNATVVLLPFYKA